MQNTEHKTKLQTVIASAQAAIQEYERAERELAGMDLAGGFVIRCQDIYLTFDLDAAGYLSNPRPCRPHQARSFARAQAEELAAAVVNANGQRGEAVHVTAAVAAALDAQRGVLEALSGFMVEAIQASTMH